MATYHIEDPATGKTLELEGDSPPTQAELEQIFSSVGSGPKPNALSGAADATASVLPAIPGLVTPRLGLPITPPSANGTPVQPTSQIPDGAASLVSTLTKNLTEPAQVFRNLTQPITRPLAAGADIIRKNPEGALSAIPALAALAASVATGGAATLPAMAAVGTTAAGGEAFKQIGQRLIGSQNAPKTSGEAAAAIGITGAENALLEGGARAVAPVLETVASKLASTSVDFARRALGFTKIQLGSTKSAFEAARKLALANKSAEEMLTKGAISKVGDAETTTVNAMNILRAAKSQMDTVLSTVNDAGASISPDHLGPEIIDAIKPKFANQQAAVSNLLDDIQVVANGPLDLNHLQELKQRWGKIGYDYKTAGTEEAAIYRKATKFVDDKISEIIDAAPEVGDSLGKIYRSAKSTASSATTALKGLSNKISSAAGNNIYGLPEYAVAAGQMASGNIPEALVTLGITKSIRSRGAAVTANAFRGASRVADATAPSAAPVTRFLAQLLNGQYSPQGNPSLAGNQ